MAEYMKCLCVKQPWAWLIIHGGKDIENRDWFTSHRGPLLIAASKGKPTKADLRDAAYLAAKIGVTLPDAFDFGGIVGEVKVTGCVTESDSPWFFGKFGWILRDPKPLQFRPITGQLGLFGVKVND